MGYDVGSIDSHVTLDYSEFAEGMSAVIALAQSFGQQLQTALGASTQGLSTTDNVAEQLRTSFEAARDGAEALSKAMANTNTTLAQFSNVEATTSRMGQMLNVVTGELRDVSVNASNIAPNIQKATTSASSLRSQLEWIPAKLAEAYQSTQQMAAGLSQMPNGVEGTSAKVDQIKNSLQAAFAALNQFTGKFKQSKAEANELSNAAKQIKKHVAQDAAQAKKLSDNLEDSAAWARDLRRIVGGIVISQGFYAMANMMKTMVADSWQFMQNMEQATIAMKYLTGSEKEANSLMTSLQDFAVMSPLDTEAAVKSSRLLMNMGFQAEGILTVLEAITDASVVAGTDMSDSIYRISLALGQMLQSGTAKAQELKQLYDAGFPVAKALNEELGLTGKQIANIGKQGIDSGTVVTALLNYMQKHFGGAAEEMQNTMSGAASAIKDSFYVIFSEVMSGPYETMRTMLVGLKDQFEELVKVARTSGAGGVFEALIPKELQTQIRVLLAAFQQLWYAAGLLKDALGVSLGSAFQVLITMLNTVLPPITMLIHAIAGLANYLIQTVPYIKQFIGALLLLLIAKVVSSILLGFFKIFGLAKIVSYASKAIIGFGKSMVAVGMFIKASPLNAALIAIVAVLGLLILQSDRARAAMTNLWNSITGNMKKFSPTKALNWDPQSILSPVNKETEKSTTDYYASLKDIQSGLGGIQDEADKTSNKLKNTFNQSFDEVYAIDESAAGDLGLGALNDIDFSPLLDNLGNIEDALGDLGDWDFSGDMTDNFEIEWGDMWNAILDRIKDFGLPAGLAGLLAGFATGNVWIGLATALAVLFWPEIMDALELSKSEGIALLGGMIGGLLGFVIGKAIFGSTFGGLVAAAVSALFIGEVVAGIMAFKEGDAAAGVEHFEIALGAAIGAIAGGILTGGSPIGIALGAIAGALAGKLWNDASEQVGMTGSSLLAGAIAGVAVALKTHSAMLTSWAVLGGLIAGQLLGAINDGVITDDEKSKLIGSSLATVVGAGIGFAFGGPQGAAVGGIIGNLGSQFAQTWWDKFKLGLADENQALQAVNELYSTSKSIFEAVDANIVARKSVREGVEDDYEAIEALVEKAYELAGKDQLTESEEMGLLKLIDEINIKVPEAGLSFDKTTGKISKTKEETLKLTQAQKDYYLIAAAQDDIVRIYKDMYENQKAAKEAQDALTKAADEFTRAGEAWDDVPWWDVIGGYEAMAQYNNAKDALDTTAENVNNLSDQQLALNNELRSVYGILDEYNANMDTTSDKLTNTVQPSMGNTAQASKDMAEDFKTSGEEMGKTAEQTSKDITNGLYPDGGKKYKETGNLIIDSFNLGVKEEKPQVKLTIDGVASTVDDHLDNSKETYKTGKTVTTSFKDGIKAGQGSVTTALGSLLTALNNAPKSRFNIEGGKSKNFNTYGQNVTAGFVNGIEASQSSSKSAINNWADNVKGWFKKTFDIHSPSKWFYDTSQYLTMGSNNAIIDGIGSSIAAIAQWTDAMKNTTEKGLDGAIPEGSLTKGVESAADGLTEAPLTQWCASAFNIFADWSTKVSTVITEAMIAARLSIVDMLDVSQGLGQISLSNDLRTGMNRDVTTANILNTDELAYVYSKATDDAANKIISILGPIIASGNSSDENSDTSGTILQIGTLIAGNDGIRELERRLQNVRRQEEMR